MSAPRVRRELRPGDYGAIIELHGRLYSCEYGVDSSFEAMVAGSVTRAAMRGFPREREGLWVVEVDGVFSGCIALTDEDGETAMVRWVLLDPSLRGRGLGSSLVAEVVGYARDAGYQSVALETFSDLRRAARIYRDSGFTVTSEEIGPRWGRDEITYQRYELDLARVDDRDPRAASAAESLARDETIA